VLRYKVAGERIKSAFVTHRDERGGYFTLMVYPPESLWCENPFSHQDQRESLPASTSGTETRRYASLPRKPMEMIFVLDCSGSMSGKPIAQAKADRGDARQHPQRLALREIPPRRRRHDDDSRHQGRARLPA